MRSFELSDLTLEDLLPHRGDMMFVEEVVEVDNLHAITRSRVKKNWPMGDESGVDPLILVELAAQTSGVCNGWDRIHTLGIDSEKMGWLVGIKKAVFCINSLPYGEIITARADNTQNFENLRQVSCSLHMGERLIGEVILQLFQA
jgi:predicted hotdog family 3-hydroxylacyl-ACP dehydratase